MALSTHENLGTNLRKTLEKAWKWSKTQRKVAKTLNASISAGAVERWEKMVSDYKQDRRRPNPFEEHETSTSMTPCMWLVLISLQLFPSPLLGTSSCRRTPMPRKGVPFNYMIQVHQLSCGKHWMLKRNSTLIYLLLLQPVSPTPKAYVAVAPPDSILKQCL